MGLEPIGGAVNTITPLPYVIWRGAYSASAIYEPKSIVKWTDGIAYIQKQTKIAITNIPPTDTDNWEVFTATGAASTIAWTNITGKPTTFNAGTLQGINLSATAPTANQHLIYNSGTSQWEASSYTTAWADVSGKPSTFTPSSHVHDTADVTTGIFDVLRIPDLNASKITAGSLTVARGGTGLSALGGANTIPGVNSGGTALEYKTITAGTNISVVHAANSVTINSTSTGTVTNVGLSLPAMFTVSGTPVTTTGTLSAVLASQSQNLVFASPDGSAGSPVFRGLAAGDIPSLNASIIGAGTLPVARGGTGQVTANAALNAFLPIQTSNAGKVLSTDGTNTSWISAGGAGTVTSVGLSVPSIFTVANSPVTASGTLAISLASQTQNYFLAAPNGSSGVPTFRAPVAADLPTHSHVKADITDFAHDHNSLYYTKTELNTASAGGAVAFANITSFPTQFDALSLQTRTVASTAPTNGQVLTYNTSLTRWEPASPAGTGDMLKSQYDTNNDGIVDSAAAAPWSGITGKPSTFTPSTHTHVSTDVTDFTEAAQDAIGAALTDSASIDFTYSDVGNTITAIVKVDASTIIAGGSSIGAANTTALWNANQFQGRAFASTAPTDGQTIVWSSGSSTWLPSSAADPSPSFATLTDGGTVTWNLNSIKVNNATLSIAGNRTLAFSNVVAGATGVLIVKQDATGGRTLALPAGSKVVNTGAGSWTPTVGASKVDILSFIYDGTNYWWTIGKDYS